jgi:hypothetical protein
MKAASSVTRSLREQQFVSLQYDPNFLEDGNYVLKRYDVGNFDISTDDVVERVCTACLQS